MFKLEVSWRGVFALAAAAFALWLIPQVWAVVLLIAVAFIFMAALLPYVEWLVRRRFPRARGARGHLRRARHPRRTRRHLRPRHDRRIHGRPGQPPAPRDAQRLEDFLDDFGVEVELSDRAEEINWTEVVSGRVAVDYGQKVLFGLLSAITIIVLTAYLLIDAPKMKAYIYRFIPDHREREMDELLEAMGRVVGGYIRRRGHHLRHHRPLHARRASHPRCRQPPGVRRPRRVRRHHPADRRLHRHRPARLRRLRPVRDARRDRARRAPRVPAVRRPHPRAARLRADARPATAGRAADRAHRRRIARGHGHPALAARGGRAQGRPRLLPFTPKAREPVRIEGRRGRRTRRRRVRG
ncbi:MAG: AI-2E family transporter [Thermoflexaceae bacterium]|nr:AI-2E family transporter [Thermoflexaceae bacterium]